MYQASPEIRAIERIAAAWVAKAVFQMCGRSLRGSSRQPFEEFLSDLPVMDDALRE